MILCILKQDRSKIPDLQFHTPDAFCLTIYAEEFSSSNIHRVIAFHVSIKWMRFINEGYFTDNLVSFSITMFVLSFLGTNKKKIIIIKIQS